MLTHQLALLSGLMLVGPTEPVRPPPSAAPVKVPEPERFVDVIEMAGRCAIMSSTVVLFDGKPAVWHEIPDEGTELVEVHIDLKRRVVLKIAYVTRKRGI